MTTMDRQLTAIQTYLKEIGVKDYILASFEIMRIILHEEKHGSIIKFERNKK